MALRIEQGFEYQRNDWWKWWIWVEGAEDELDKIDHVVYTLHPTFPDPVRTVRDRDTKFLLKATGWGVFRIYAMIVDRNGGKKSLYHDLVLKYPDGRFSEA